MEKLETHYYDGKLIDLYTFILAERVELLKDLRDRFREVLLSLNSKLSLVAYNVLVILINSIGTGSNFDNTNNINGDDLLLICSSLVDNEDFILLLNSQLEEMTGGMCPQGRVDRLLQTLLPFLEIDQKISD